MSQKREPDEFEYKERETPDMSKKFFFPGAGRISGYLSITLGAMSLLGVLCFRYPTYLTTSSFRGIYDVEFLRILLKIVMWLSLLLGVSNFIRNKRKRMGAVGVVLTMFAFAFGGYNVPVGELHQSKLSFGVDWLVLDLLISATLFIFIEKIIPKYEEQAILRPEWQLDLLYFGINHLLIGILLFVSNDIVPKLVNWAVNAKLQTWIQSQAIIWQVLILIVVADLVQYWVHRIFHTVPRLWNVHAVHHCVEHMDWLAGSRNHIVQILVDRTLVTLPLYLLGANTLALNIYVLIASFQAVFIHANVRIPFGPLKYIIATPQFHHWHHSSEKPAIDTNYAIHLPVLDMIFGTFHLPGDKWPAKYGTVDPLPRSYAGQFLFPFQDRQATSLRAMEQYIEESKNESESANDPN